MLFRSLKLNLSQTFQTHLEKKVSRSSTTVTTATNSTQISAPICLISSIPHSVLPDILSMSQENVQIYPILKC